MHLVKTPHNLARLVGQDSARVEFGACNMCKEKATYHKATPRSQDQVLRLMMF